MAEKYQPVIPMEAIGKGRNLEDVLSAYMTFWGRAKEFATSSDKSEDEIFEDTLMLTAYRIYLLGVEDGLRGNAK